MGHVFVFQSRSKFDNSLRNLTKFDGEFIVTSVDIFQILISALENLRYDSARDNKVGGESRMMNPLIILASLPWLPVEYAVLNSEQVQVHSRNYVGNPP
jgi:hypothetical protein